MPVLIRLHNMGDLRKAGAWLLQIWWLAPLSPSRIATLDLPSGIVTVPWPDGVRTSGTPPTERV
jgi:hypothetical protein